MTKKRMISLDIMCMDDGEIYLGEVKEKKGEEARTFHKDRKVCVTREVLDAVVNYMSLHIKDEDIPEYVMDVMNKESEQKAVLTFRIINDKSGDVMFK